ncbi:MAG: MerR family transcriptional regulator [Oscillospiraceae bacterium]
MKIKEVCRKTGLTEKAVRYYVGNGLCSPQEYESRGRTYLNFTDKNIAELDDIAAMRRLGFSVEDIRTMKEDGASIDAVMSRYIRSLSEELDMKKRIFSSLAYRSYSDIQSLDRLMPTLREVLRPDPALPDFSKFEDGLFDDSEEELTEHGKFGRLVRLQEMLITYAAVFGTLLALTTLPGVVLFLLAVLVCRKVRADFVLLYKVLLGTGLLANITAFVRSAESIGGIVRLSDIVNGSVLGFATIQCALYLVACCAQLVSLLMLIFGRKIKEYFYDQL